MGAACRTTSHLWVRRRVQLCRGVTAGGSHPGSGDQKGTSAERGGLSAAWSACSGIERHQLVVLSLSGAMLNVGFGCVIPALPALSQELGFGATGVGLLLAAPGLARVLCNLPSGAVVDRIGRVPAMVVGEMTAAFGCLGTAFGGSLGPLLAARFVGGFGGALAAAGSAAYLADMTEKRHLRPFRGAIVGAQGGFIAAAYVVGPAIGGILTEHYGAQGAYCVVAGLIATCGAAYATLPEQAIQARGGQVHAFRLVQSAAREWKELLQDPRQQALFAANSTLFLNYAATVTVLPLQAFHVFGTSAGGIGALFSAGSVIGILVAPLSGALSDRLGRTALVPAAAVTCALGCFGVAFCQQWECFVAAYFLWSVGEAVLSPLLIAYAADIAPKANTGSALALSRQSGDLVFFLAPLLLGLLYDAFPGQATMAFTGLLTLLGGAAFQMRVKIAR